MLQRKDGLWIEEVWFAIATPLVFATNWQTLGTWDRSPWRICDVMAGNCLFSNCVETDSAKT